ncbi:3-keto-steroid reductase [Sporothrix epigloea]|uniref:3-keto-steroid reductase n=1 Tax=Sporothrix epigloea TaxID=1892477 RepID=A0ABP0DCS6_9PEZI
MSAAPWDDGAAAKQLFVLVTGANSGIGLGIGQRLIDDFVAAHPSASDHLIVITTTRSAAKSRQTTNALRQYLETQEARAAASATRTLHPGRIHLASIELDLCNLPSVHAAAERLRFEPLAIYTGAGRAAPSPHTIPRLDSVIFNAGIGGWTGINWWNLLTNMLCDGIQQATTFPTCKAAMGGLLVDPLTGKEVSEAASGANTDDVIGQVFCANTFGHYVFAHALLPLLRGTSESSTGQSSKSHGQSVLGPGPARIIWESSVEAYAWENLSLDDFQGIHTIAAYESSKRLMDVLALSANLKCVAPVSASFFKADDTEVDDVEASGGAAQPGIYVTHPGVVCSTIFPLNWFFFALYNLGMYFSRWLGSPWHPVTAYKGAAAACWVALQSQATLDALDAQHVKWGTGTTRGGTALVKRSEVAGWGFRGLVGEDLELASTDSVTGKSWDDGKGDPLAPLFPYPAYLLNSRGRKKGAAILTAELREEFEVLGRDCWREMERLRKEWDERVRKARKDGAT